MPFKRFLICSSGGPPVFIKNLISVDGTPWQIPAFDLTKASAKFEVATSNGLGGDAFTRNI